MQLQRSDLLFDYEWEAVEGDDPNYTGAKDRDKLHRKEGYEVLPFINKLMRDYELTKDKGLRIEYLIRKKLPSSFQMKDLIEEWLVKEINKIEDLSDYIKRIELIKKVRQVKY